MASHQPRKRFGQNFLRNPAIIAKIIDALNIQPTDRLVEIGPGQGALTKLLLERVLALTAIEIDRDLIGCLQHLNNNSRLTLIEGDALAIDYSQLGTNLRIVGNLPYNISTPLLIHLLSFAPLIEDMHFMLQKEVVERLVGKCGEKNYGRLSLLIQYHCEVTYLFDVPPEAFYPQPKVDSAVVRLTPYQQSPYPLVCVDNLQKVVAQSFGMRRKTLINNLKCWLSADELIELGINPRLRPEQISLEEYIKLTNFLAERISNSGN